MSEDPRELLDEAARRRSGCQVMLRGGAWTRGQLVRVDKVGVLLTAPELGLVGGEDVRVWFSLDEHPYTFDASVLRAGVPVPDRSPHGVILGYIAGFGKATQLEALDSPQVTVLPPEGRGVELVGGGARLVEAGPEEISFAIPQDERLKFVEGGRVRLRFHLPGQVDHLVSGRVRRVLPAEQHYLYAVSFDAVEDARAHLDAIELVRRLL